MMPDQPKDEAHSSASDVSDLRGQIDRVSAENLVLKQRLEFSDLFAKQEKAQSDQFAAHKKYVEDTITKRLVALSLVGVVLLGVAWYQTITPVRKTVQERLDKEFASDNIRTMISDAAQKAASVQAKQLIETTIKPVTAQALIDIQQHRDEVSSIAEQLKKNTHNTVSQMQVEVSAKLAKDEAAFAEIHTKENKQLDDLTAIVSYQDKLKNIQLLKSEAIGGVFASFAKLDAYPADDVSLKDAASAAVLETKLAYATGDRVRGVSIWMNNPDGTKGLTDEAIPTGGLIGLFLLNGAQNWQLRVRAAQFLASRREADVPPVLLSSMNNDPNLWVRRAALVSFQQVCGFQSNDAFGFQEATDWWDKNKTSYLNSIPKK